MHTPDTSRHFPLILYTQLHCFELHTQETATQAKKQHKAAIHKWSNRLTIKKKKSGLFYLLTDSVLRILSGVDEPFFSVRWIFCNEIHSESCLCAEIESNNSNNLASETRINFKKCKIWGLSRLQEKDDTLWRYSETLYLHRCRRTFLFSHQDHHHPSFIQGNLWRGIFRGEILSLLLWHLIYLVEKPSKIQDTLCTMSQRMTVRIIWRTAYLFTLHLSVSRCLFEMMYLWESSRPCRIQNNNSYYYHKHVRREKLSFNDNKTGPYKMLDESSRLS